MLSCPAFYSFAIWCPQCCMRLLQKKKRERDGARGANCMHINFLSCTHIYTERETPCGFIPKACSSKPIQAHACLHLMEALFRRISIMRQHRSTLNSCFTSHFFTYTSDLLFHSQSGWLPPSSHSAGHPMAVEDNMQGVWGLMLTLGVHSKPVSVIRYRYREAARIKSN